MTDIVYRRDIETHSDLGEVSMATILVIEDTLSVRKTLTQLLEVEGYQTLEAANGMEGIALARRYLPDLILCDVTMPGLDGYETIKTIRQEAALAQIPFIFLTARAERADMRYGMNLGADDYITKPFEASDLLTAIQTRLAKYAALTGQSEQRLEELRKSIAHALPHELRTPLTQMIGFSELLINNLDNLDVNDFVESVRHINLSALRMHRLVENFLYYAQLEAIRVDSRLRRALRKESFTAQARAVIIAASTRIATDANRRSDLTLTVGEAALPISPENLDRLVAELVDNAFKFSETGTSVAITAKTIKDRYTVTITDHGRGLSADQIAQIGAYMQFDRRRYEQQGCGLGLVIAQRLAELHGGQLTLTSTPGRSTTVRLTLPLASKPKKKSNPIMTR